MLVQLLLVSVQENHPRFPGKAGWASNAQRKPYLPDTLLAQDLCVLPPLAELMRGTKPPSVIPCLQLPQELGHLVLHPACR